MKRYRTDIHSTCRHAHRTTRSDCCANIFFTGHLLRDILRRSSWCLLIKHHQPLSSAEFIQFIAVKLIGKFWSMLTDILSYDINQANVSDIDATRVITVFGALSVPIGSLLFHWSLISAPVHCEVPRSRFSATESHIGPWLLSSAVVFYIVLCSRSHVKLISFVTGCAQSQSFSA